MANYYEIKKRAARALNNHLQQADEYRPKWSEFVRTMTLTHGLGDKAMKKQLQEMYPTLKIENDDVTRQ